MVLTNINILLASVTDFMYYHGVNKEDIANKIMVEGLVPPPIPEHKHKMTPRDSSIYFTPHIAYALIYALGGNMAGHRINECFIEESRYGYVFGANIKEIRDKMVPDEDSIGELLNYKLQKRDYECEDGSIIKHTDIPYELEQIAYKHLTERQLAAAKDYDDYADLCVIGKKLTKYISDTLRNKLIDLGAHVSYAGSVIPEHVWKVDKCKSELYKANGSNFFELSEKIK